VFGVWLFSQGAQNTKHETRNLKISVNQHNQPNQCSIRIMKIAVLGSGGREHAIVWKLVQGVSQTDIYTLPGNGGIPNSLPINITKFDDVKRFCEEKHIELVVVGPEAPLAQGIVDYFANTRIKVFGPSKNAARLESSKIWAKQFMAKYEVATADFRIFYNPEDAKKRIHELKGDLVIKYDGLAGGKGVYVCSSEAEALASLEDLVKNYGADAPFLIEEKLIGSEISIIGFTDGKHIQLLTPSQDHKQLYDGDTGPNTGGMGAYCPVTFLTDAMMKDIMTAIVNPTLRGLQGENLDYKGAIYFGLMMTAQGARLLEYNVRLGDPEAEVILPAMKGDLLQLILSCLDGTLKDYEMEFNEGFFVDVVLVSGGYPKSYAKGYEISGLKHLSQETLVFHAGTALKDGKLVTSGGRVLNIVANGVDLASTIEKVYQECKLVEFQDIYYRKDIGKRNLVLFR
jgi:phosphoribosylamine--glycine ligase